MVFFAASVCDLVGGRDGPEEQPWTCPTYPPFARPDRSGERAVSLAGSGLPCRNMSGDARSSRMGGKPSRPCPAQHGHRLQVVRGVIWLKRMWCAAGQIREGASVLQRKTNKPVRFEIREATQISRKRYMENAPVAGSEYPWPGGALRASGNSIWRQSAIRSDRRRCALIGSIYSLPQGGKCLSNARPHLSCRWVLPLGNTRRPLFLSR